MASLIVRARADASGLTWRGTVCAFAAILGFAVTAFAPQVLNDGDTYLHIAAGARMLADHAVLTRDPFSYTFAGAPWDAHEWLAEIAMGAAWRWGGMAAVLALFATAAALAAYVLGRMLGRFLAPGAQAATALVAMACMAGSLLARPHLLALPLLAIWTAELAIARAERRAPRMVFAALMALWVNIHGSFLLGLALAGAMALEALAEAPRWTTARAWLQFGLAALACTLLNPHFVDGVIFPFALMATPALSYIGEWQAAPVTLLQPVVPATAAALYIIVTRRVPISPVRATTLLILAALAFTHARHQMIFAMVAPMLLAEPLSRLAPPNPAPGARQAILAGAALLSALFVARLIVPVPERDSAVAPVQALAHVPPALRSAHVLNDYSFGGYLIFAGVRPFIDSRVELYGQKPLETYAALLSGDRAALTRTLARDDVRWTILKPSSPVAGELDTLPGWHRLYADAYAVVHIRDRNAAPPAQ